MFEQALDHAAVFTHSETDENGNPRTLAVPRASRMPRLRVIDAFIETPADRAIVFARFPLCCYCGEALEAADQGGIIPTEQGARLAHRESCFVPAMRDHAPMLALRAAVGRVGNKVHAIAAPATAPVTA